VLQALQSRRLQINRLIDVARKNRFVVVVVYLGLAGWGWWALTSTPIDAIPELPGNRIIVFTGWLLHVLVVTLVIFLWIRERRLGLPREPPPRHQVMSLSTLRILGNDDRTEQLHGIDNATAREDRTPGLVTKGEQKDQLVAMLGHELRHPLTPITHAIYLLRKSHQDPATIELLDTIDTQTQTLVRFVNELLDLSRISHGLIEIHPERLDLVAVARDAVHALQPFIEERQHVVSLVLPAAPSYVRGDPGRLRQVVSNLVENAAKYTEPGGRITVALEQRATKRCWP
jgi:signal transduction histidine kinase